MESAEIFRAEWWPAVGLFFGFFVTAYFSMIETALTSLTAAEAERLSAQNNFWSRSLKQWIVTPNRLLASILLGNTLTNTAIAVVAFNFVSHTLGLEDREGAQAFLTLMISVLILIVGEITPKMLARTYPKEIAPVGCRILVIFHFVLYPITFLITRFVLVMLRSVGVMMPSQRSITATDIEQIINRAGQEGVMAREKSAILKSVFQFSKRRVRDIMISKDRISALSVDSSLVEALDIVRRENHSRYPVFKGSLDRIVGFLHARDLFAILKSYGFSEGARPPLESFSLRTCLRRAFFVSEQAMISSVLNEMKTNRIHLAIVKDEWGNVVGLVTLEDILEEVFGEIEDEHDERNERPIIDLYETGIEVPGEISLADLNSRYEVQIDSSESYSSLNGFLQHYASHQQLSPKMVIIWRNYVFTVLEASDGEVHKVRITQIPEEDRSGD